MRAMKVKPVFSDGRVHVMAEKCATCIFRPGNLMSLEPGRVAGMVREARSSDAGNIPCHETLYGQSDQKAVCRGFFDKHATPVLQIADRMGIIDYVEAG